MHNTLQEQFCYLLRVRFYECDAQNVVFNARYGDYVDTAATEFFRVMFGNYKNLIEQGIDSQVVKLSTQWRSSAQFDDVVAITVKTTHMGNTSFTLSAEFYDYATGREIAVSDITYVLIDTKLMQKMPIPEDMREKLLAGAPGVLTNHAGAETN
jgi:acyl-CoA thioester hydrolase